MNNNNLFNRKGLKSFRSSLRNKSTSAEAALWKILKSKNLNGRKFRRQYSIDSYIVDFSINHPGLYQPLQYFDYHLLRPPLLQKEGKLL
jgi:very-short-patch-repair endonuclease